MLHNVQVIVLTVSFIFCIRSAASEFSPFVPNFSLVPSCEGKIRYVPEKNGTGEKIQVRSQVPDRWAGADRKWRAWTADRAWMAGRAWMGAGAGQGGGESAWPYIKRA